MKSDKIRLLAAGLAVMFALMPIRAHAASGVNGVRSGEPGTICHCGGTRQLSHTERFTPEPCAEHGAVCSDYFYVEVLEYYHCSNPHCTDVWYGNVVKTYYMHIRGR